MILDGVCYPVSHFCRVILYVWGSPPIASMSLACTLGGTSVLCVSPSATLLTICSSRLSALPSGEGVLTCPSFSRSSFFDMHASRQPHVFLPFFRLFFCTIAVFPLYGEYVARFPLPGGVFLRHRRLDFFNIGLRVRIQLINQSIVIRFLFFIPLIADGPHHYHPAWGH